MGKKARQQLRDNVRRIFRERITRFNELIRTGAVKRTTLNRIVSDEGAAVRLEQLDDLAHVLQVEPWQLLHPDFDQVMLTEWAVKIARKMDDLPEGIKTRAYARFAQDVEFANGAVRDVLKQPLDDEPIA